MIRVFLCDDQTITLEGLKTILSVNPDIEVVGMASNGAEALTRIPQASPDLILMDLKMPVMNGVQATRLIRERYPHIPVLVLTTYDGDEWVFDAIRAGASGYLLKDSPRDELVAAVRGTMAGRTHVDPSVAGKLFEQVQQHATPTDQMLLDKLSERETTVLRLLARGMNNRRISQLLHLSEGTVRNYVSTICAKLEVEDRMQAAVLAIRNGLGEA